MTEKENKKKQPQSIFMLGENRTARFRECVAKTESNATAIVKRLIDDWCDQQEEKERRKNKKKASED